APDSLDGSAAGDHGAGVLCGRHRQANAMTSKNANRTLVLKLGLVAVAMFGFGFALVPLYRVLCDISGLGGRLSQQSATVVAADYEVDASRLVTVEFLATVNNNAGWVFRPTTAKMQVHPGEL